MPKHQLIVGGPSGKHNDYHVYYTDAYSGEHVDVAEGLSLAHARLLIEAENMLSVLGKIHEYMDAPVRECPLPSDIASNVRYLTHVLGRRYNDAMVHSVTLPLVDME